MVALEAVYHDEEVDADETGFHFWRLTATAFDDAIFGDLLASLDHTDELLV